MADLLLELFSEEIPAGMQKDASESMLKSVLENLAKQKIEIKDSRIFYSPRRVGFAIHGIPEQQPDVSEERKGPKVGAPDAAMQGFLKSTGMTLEELKVQKDAKGDFYIAEIHRKGRKTSEVLKEILEEVICSFTWPKSMKWGNREIRWVRPLHSILCIFGSEVIPVKFGHLTASNVTYGHRFLANSEKLQVANEKDYFEKLEKAFVIAEPEKRKDIIANSLEKLAKENGVKLVTDEHLLDEVTNLVEWPVALIGAIDAKFLHLPPEVLRTVLKNHQRYFIFDDGKANISHFATVSNIEAKDGGKAILAGNQRVLRARLEDARFFWEQDQKIPLENYNEKLKNVIFHAKVGTVGEKIERIKNLALTLADSIPGADKKLVERAATLAKSDLATGMVGELPELQGVMGRYYALAQGEEPEVAMAISDHYKPAGLYDSIPADPISITLALADKLDTLVSLFQAGEKPTGSRDPFALRRAALGVIRIAIQNNISFPLSKILNEELRLFFLDRMRVVLKESGIRHDYISAAFNADKECNLHQIKLRAEALQSFIETDDGQNLLTAYRRAANIFKIEAAKEKKEGFASGNPDKSLFKEKEESALLEALEKAEKELKANLEKHDYIATMKELAALRTSVDSFFEKVMVNDKEPAVRENRLKILGRIRSVIDTVADFGSVEATGKEETVSTQKMRAAG